MTQPIGDMDVPAKKDFELRTPSRCERDDANRVAIQSSPGFASGPQRAQVEADSELAGIHEARSEEYERWDGMS